VGSLVNSKALTICFLLVLTSSLLLLDACGNAQADPAAGAPPPAKIVPFFDVSLFQVQHPEQFPLVTAGEYTAAPELSVTGAVNPDVSLQVPVPSLATGRIVEIDARLGDVVKKGKLLFKVRSADIAGAFSSYLQAVKNEELTKIQLDRANDLFQNGAIPKASQEIAQNAEDDNVLVLNQAKEQLGLLGSDPDHPTGIVSVYAPVSGTITDQEITNQSAVQSYSSPTPFTISDMSKVWIVCDVYENDMASVKVGDQASVVLNAFPDKVLHGTVNNIGVVLDPNLRTAKVRIEVANPGDMMRLGMFATATFRGRKTETYTEVPASAVLHLHDRDWVYVPAPDRKFRRVEVVDGDPLPDNMQAIKSGLAPGQQVVANAVVMEHTIATNQ
jgi:cobalt-zinc-cadmium efflux system membrane fusion protein